MKPRGIGKPLLADLMLDFLRDSGYEITFRGKKVEYPLDFTVFFRKFFTYLVAITAGSRRFIYSHLCEFEFVDSKRKEGQTILRLRPHTTISKFFRKNPTLVYSGDDYAYDSLKDRSYIVYNELVEAQDTTRDSIIITTSNHDEPTT